MVTMAIVTDADEVPPVDGVGDVGMLPGPALLPQPLAASARNARACQGPIAREHELTSPTRRGKKHTNAPSGGIAARADRDVLAVFTRRVTPFARGRSVPRNRRIIEISMSVPPSSSAMVRHLPSSKRVSDELRERLSAVADISEVRCQRICKGPVVGAAINGSLEWFERVRSDKVQGQLRRSRRRQRRAAEEPREAASCKTLGTGSGDKAKGKGRRPRQKAEGTWQKAKGRTQLVRAA